MISSKKKQTIIKDNQRHATDSGSVEVQVAIMSERINELTDHLKTHKKDLSSRLGLMKIVAERRKLMTYLKRTNLARYEALAKKLDLRK